MNSTCATGQENYILPSAALFLYGNNFLKYIPNSHRKTLIWIYLSHFYEQENEYRNGNAGIQYKHLHPPTHTVTLKTPRTEHPKKTGEGDCY